MTGLAQFAGTSVCPKQHREFRSPHLHNSKSPEFCRRPKTANFNSYGLLHRTLALPPLRAFAGVK